MCSFTMPTVTAMKQIRNAAPLPFLFYALKPGAALPGAKGVNIDPLT